MHLTVVEVQTYEIFVFPNERREDFVQERVIEGRSILGRYPPTEVSSRTEFANWRKAKGR